MVTFNDPLSYYVWTNLWIATAYKIHPIRHIHTKSAVASADWAYILSSYPMETLELQRYLFGDVFGTTGSDTAWFKVANGLTLYPPFLNRLVTPSGLVAVLNIPEKDDHELLSTAINYPTLIRRELVGSAHIPTGDDYRWLEEIRRRQYANNT